MAMTVDDHPAVTSRRFPALSAGSSRRVQVRGQEDDAEMTRVLKKHRTSSEAPVPGAQNVSKRIAKKTPLVPADLEAFANEEREVDPEGDEWDTSMLKTQMTGSWSASTVVGDLQVHEGGRGISPFPRDVAPN